MKREASPHLFGDKFNIYMILITLKDDYYLITRCFNDGYKSYTVSNLPKFIKQKYKKRQGAQYLALVVSL